MNNSSAIIAALRAAGIDAFAPGGHEGLCLSPYCVVQQLSGVLIGGRGGCARYRVHLFVPCGGSGTDALAELVRQALRPMEETGSIRIAEPRGATLTDERYRALSSFIDYLSYYRER